MLCLCPRFWVRFIDPLDANWRKKRDFPLIKENIESKVYRTCSCLSNEDTFRPFDSEKSMKNMLHEAQIPPFWIELVWVLDAFYTSKHDIFNTFRALLHTWMINKLFQTYPLFEKPRKIVRERSPCKRPVMWYGNLFLWQLVYNWWLLVLGESPALVYFYMSYIIFGKVFLNFSFSKFPQFPLAKLLPNTARMF